MPDTGVRFPYRIPIIWGADGTGIHPCLRNRFFWVQIPGPLPMFGAIVQLVRMPAYHAGDSSPLATTNLYINEK